MSCADCVRGGETLYYIAFGLALFNLILLVAALTIAITQSFLKLPNGCRKKLILVRVNIGLGTVTLNVGIFATCLLAVRGCYDCIGSRAGGMFIFGLVVAPQTLGFAFMLLCVACFKLQRANEDRRRNIQQTAETE